MKPEDILAKVYFHDMPEENDYNVYDIKGNTCDGCVPAYIVTRSWLDDLLKDKARLDWLADVDNKLGNVQLPRDIVERNLHSMRAAIDEAMAIESTRS